LVTFAASATDRMGGHQGYSQLSFNNCLPSVLLQEESEISEA